MKQSISAPSNPMPQVYDMNFIAQQQQLQDGSQHSDQFTTPATALLMNHGHTSASPPYAAAFPHPPNFLPSPHSHTTIPAQFTQQYGLLQPIQPNFHQHQHPHQHQQPGPLPSLPTHAMQHPNLGMHHQSIATTNTSGQSNDATSSDAGSTTIGNGLHTALRNSMYNLQTQMMQGNPLPFQHICISFICPNYLRFSQFKCTTTEDSATVTAINSGSDSRSWKH
jgi:hypothetical protein